jgi:peptidoglycan/LPS O-acetylase OafA/YrhL
VVLIAHASSMFTAEHDPIFWRKYLAVYFFFMLSGFVIASAYDDRLRTGSSRRRFGLLRIIRLYPLVILGALTSAASLALFSPSGIDPSSLMLATAFSMASMPYPGSPFGFSHFPINPPEWSLFFEMIAYAVFATIVPRLQTRYLGLVVLFCIGIFLIVAAHYSFADAPFRSLIFGVIGSFLAGVWLWRVRQQQSLRCRPLPFPLLAIALIGVCSLPKAMPGVLDVVIVFTVFPFVLLSGAADRQRDSRMLQFLGDISYPVYILHWGILQSVALMVLPVVGRGVAIAMGASLSIAFAWIALKSYDEPLRAYLARRVRHAGARPSQSAPIAAP